MSWLTDGVVKFIGDTHRPIALLIVAIAFLWGVVNRLSYPELTAIGLVLTGLYWGKSAENITVTRATPPAPQATQ